MSVEPAKRVLVVDDNRAIREYLHFLLQDEGYEVDEAENGAAALERLAETPADLVITDISMPHKDGIDAIIEMRDTHPSVKIIAMSGVAKSGTLLEIAKLYRADIALKKPFTSEDILGAVESVLG